jgi:hypothetical protein
MDKGIVIFGHNSKELDYVKLANMSAGYATRNLGVPVTLITDHHSVTTTSSALENIDNLLVIDRPDVTNTRLLSTRHIEFINTNRYLAFKYSPYSRTLLIDSDFFILTDRLNSYWDSNQEFMITEGMISVGERLATEATRLSPTTIPMRWATAIMFSKTEFAETIFKIVEYVKDNWFYFVDLYNIPPTSFRNDFAFTIANHIANGFVPTDNFLPSPLMTLENFKVQKFTKDKIIFDDIEINNDVHIMNKFNLQELEIE